jgi:hypothetical protein
MQNKVLNIIFIDESQYVASRELRVTWHPGREISRKGAKNRQEDTLKIK